MQTLSKESMLDSWDTLRLFQALVEAEAKYGNSCNQVLRTASGPQ